ncbi:hypothetical protein C5S29_11710 [ANME-1 cluster archaeon GoMg3.2]|nr:hypothetical protein [ANME-1 cluster archaeon GoMg3.2]
MAKIVVDTPTRDGLGFQDYADALVNIIVDSGSPFTIGILGEWGVGKTSLMQTMREKLNDEHGKDIIPIWFNAWRCERERNLAIIPLLQLLVSEIKDNKLRKAFIEILKSLQLKFSLPGGVELSAGGVSQNQVEGDLYYAELDAIETTLKETDKKIVVFIDDLDRCAPDKILEVLESTKVFLDIKGFVYVLGLSPEVIVKAIEQKYEDMGINGEDYLEKIVQIPFRIPDWNVTDRGDFLTDLVDKDKIDPTYKSTIGEYKDIIQEVIERTPRQVKRFINTYICEQEIFKEKELDQTIHLVLTILKFKWYNFYQKLFDEKYRQNLKEILSDENKLREELKEKKEAKGKEDNQDKSLDLVDFISKPEVREAIKNIIDMDYKQLLEYRRVGMIMPQKISESATSREKLIELLRAKKVSEFNALRGREGLEEINLSMANLSMANLNGADLRSGIIFIKEPYYQKAKVNDANFEYALISGRGFLEYLRENGAKNVPDEVSTKDEFINEMKKKGFDIWSIEQFFDEY